MATLPINFAVRGLFGTTDGEEFTFAGTGFFIVHKSRPVLIAANHVLRDFDLNVFAPPIGTASYNVGDVMMPAKPRAQNVGNDLAILDVADFDPGATLKLASKVPFSNARVGTFEYSRFELNEGQLNPNPSTRVGNIVRILTDKQFPESSLELSFPALRGASGSPVIGFERSHQLEVCGIVVANAQYELMPAQTYSYRDAEGTEEETIHYHLPAGVAVNVCWLHELLREL